MRSRMRFWLPIAALHLLAAVFSAGFLHTDEHFQVFEFWSARWNGTPVGDLPMEFGERMRPWLPAALLQAVIAPLRAAGVEDPFAWARVARLASAALGLAGLVALVRMARRAFAGEPRRLALATGLAAWLWFLPALHARTSSENHGSAWLALGTALALGSSPAPAAALAGGACLGMAFHLRYQLGVMIAVLAIGATFFRRLPPRRLAWIAAGMAATLVLGAVVDRVGYGEWTLPAWNYLRWNLLEGRVNLGEISPPWDYFRRAATESFPILGLLTLLALLAGSLRAVRAAVPAAALLGAAALALLVTHFAIPHQELRFLYPVAALAPLLVPFAFTDAAWGRLLALGRGVPARALIGLNLLALGIAVFSPAWGPWRVYAALSDEARAGSVRDVWSPGEPAFAYLGMPLRYFRPATLVLHAGAPPAEASRPFAVWEESPGGAPPLPSSSGCELRAAWPPPIATDLLARLGAQSLLTRARHTRLHICREAPPR